MKKRLMLAAGAAAAALYILAARRLPVGCFNDDAANILLARALRGGRFAFPGGLGAPEEFLPGFPLLLVLPAWMAEPRWNLLKIIPLLSSFASIWLTWRLAKKFLSPHGALAAAFLTALNPVLLGLSGLVMPYSLYLALTLRAFEALEENRFAVLCACTAAAALLRPQALVLAPALALAAAWKSGPRRGAAVAAAGLVPVALWTLRNRFLISSPQDYIGTWRAHVASLGEFSLQLSQAEKIFDSLLSQGWLALPHGEITAVVLGAAAVLGAGALLRKRSSPAVFAMSAYAALILALHMTWHWVQTRYAMPIVPLAWIFALAGAEAAIRRPALSAAVLSAVFGAAALRYDLAYAREGLAGSSEFEPKTAAWLENNAPPDARVESLWSHSFALLGGRPCAPRPIGLEPRDWRRAAEESRVDFVQLQVSPRGEFQLGPESDAVDQGLSRWLKSSGGAELVFQDEEEGSEIFRLRR